MTNRLVHRLLAIIATVAGGITLGLVLSSHLASEVVGYAIAGGWIILGFLAWLDSLKIRGTHFRTPLQGIYGVRPPPTYVRSRQYPPSHVRILQNGPQNPLE